MSGPEAPAIGSIAPAFDAGPKLGSPTVSLDTFAPFHPSEFFRPTGAMDISFPDVGGRRSLTENPFSYSVIASQPEPIDLPDTIIPAAFIKAFSDNTIPEPFIRAFSSEPINERLIAVEGSLMQAPAPLVVLEAAINLSTPSVVPEQDVVEAKSQVVDIEPISVILQEPRVVEPEVSEIKAPQLDTEDEAAVEQKVELVTRALEQSEPQSIEATQVKSQEQVLLKIQALRERLAQLSDQIDEKQLEQDEEKVNQASVAVDKFYFLEATEVMVRRYNEPMRYASQKIQKDGFVTGEEIGLRLPVRREDLESPIALELGQIDKTFPRFRSRIASAGVLETIDEVSWVVEAANRENRAVTRGKSGLSVSDQEVKAVVSEIDLASSLTSLLGAQVSIQHEIDYALTQLRLSAKIQTVQPPKVENGLEKVTTGNTTHN
jgi:hypothetical protein